MLTTLFLAAESVGGIDLKQLLLTVFVLAVIGLTAYFFTAKWPAPAPFNWFIYLVLGIVAVLIVWRFIQGI